MPVSYIGGKSKIGTWIRDYIPEDMQTYVEPFGGMFWLFFKTELEKYKDLNRVVYNDVNHLNYNFFLCLQSPDRFYEAMDEIPCQEKGINDDNDKARFLELFNSFQEEIYSDGFEIEYPDFETASKYMYVITQIWSGYNPEGANYIYLKGNYKAKYQTFKEKLQNPKWLQYFNRITDVNSMDFAELMDEYDDKKSFFYLDPPYYSREKYYNNHDFNIDDHLRLSQYLKNIEGKFALSYYPFDGLEDMYPKDEYRWVEKDFVKGGGARKGQKQNFATELLIMNY